MIRRDTERKHTNAHNLFDSLSIYDIQGLLTENGRPKCGVESYQVDHADLVTFEVLDKRLEISRFKFCQQLGVPYYLIISIVDTRSYKIFAVSFVLNALRFDLKYSFDTQGLIKWWRAQQSFTQTKPLYDAKSRIQQSLIDQDLFQHQLTWGTNIDGFALDEHGEHVTMLFEKRICTFKPPYSVYNYDPNRFFKGTGRRSGDFPSWNTLFHLSQLLNVPLCLLTFDTSHDVNIGFSIITEVSREGLTYLEGAKPFDQILNDFDQVRARLEYARSRITRGVGSRGY